MESKPSSDSPFTAASLVGTVAQPYGKTTYTQ